MKNIIVIGIGQELRGDDAIGPEVVPAWQEQHPRSEERVRVEISPLPGLGLLDLLSGADVAILVDAVQSGAKPGTVHVVGMDQVGSFGAGSGSAHGFGVAETLALGRQADPESIPEAVIRSVLEAIGVRTRGRDDLIKRVIGLPGETITISDNSVLVDGEPIDEPYLSESVVMGDDGPFIVPNGEVFVMGDNRQFSFDSRRFGTIAFEDLVGRAFVTIWPLTNFGGL